MRVLAKNNSVLMGKEGRWGRLECLRPSLSGWVLWERGGWETGLPLEFRAELLSKSVVLGIYKTKLRTSEVHPEEPHSKGTTSR